MQSNRPILQRDALVVMNVQKDLSENATGLSYEHATLEQIVELQQKRRGALAVGGSDAIIAGINSLITGSFDEKTVIYTQKQYDANHVNFARMYGKKPFAKRAFTTQELLDFDNTMYGADKESKKITLTPKARAIVVPNQEIKDNNKSIEYTLWPEHCVQRSKRNNGAEFHAELVQLQGAPVFKNWRATAPYSCLFDVQGNPATGFVNHLAEQGIKGTLYFVGLALDYDVYYSALDTINKLKHLSDGHHRVVVVYDATKAIFEQDRAQKIADLRQAGVKILSITEVRASRALKFKLSSLLDDIDINAIANSFEDAWDAFNQLLPSDMTPSVIAIKVELLKLQQFIENFNEAELLKLLALIKNEEPDAKEAHQKLATWGDPIKTSIYNIEKLYLPLLPDKIKKTVVTLLAALVGGLTVLGLTGGLAPILAGFMAGTASPLFTGSALTAAGAFLSASGAAYGAYRFFPAVRASPAVINFSEKSWAFAWATDRVNTYAKGR
jgi:nicotinamidase-related amidase